MTSTQKEQLGFHLYLIIKYLAQKQNDVLAKLGLGKRQVGVLQARPEHSLGIGGEEIETLITRLLFNTSFTGLVYGHGRELHYDTERISKRLRDSLFLNLATFTFDDEISFEYRNLVEESNPYNQYAALNEKVGL